MDRWRLTLPDSMVHGHMSILVRYAANRKVSDDLMREYRAEAYQRQGQVIELSSAVANYRMVVSQNEREIKALEEANVAIGADLDKAQDKISRLRPWATVGKVGTVVVSVGIVGAITIAVAESVR